MWSLSLVMSECFLSGRGHGHVSNFYIVDLENFATASRRYTGDIHKSSVVGLFMTHLRQWKRLGGVMVECTLSITHCLRLNLQLHAIDLVRTCRISSSCTVAWLLARLQLTRVHDTSRGPSAIAELVVYWRYWPRFCISFKISLTILQQHCVSMRRMAFIYKCTFSLCETDFYTTRTSTKRDATWTSTQKQQPVCSL